MPLASKLAKFFCIISLIILVSAANSFAGASINGKVLDNFGNPLEGVSVTIEGFDLSAVSDSNGKYSIEYFPGKIKLNYALDGYEPSSLNLELITKDKIPAKTIKLYKIPAWPVCLMTDKEYVELKSSRVKLATVNFERKAPESIFVFLGKYNIFLNPFTLVFLDDALSNYRLRIDNGYLIPNYLSREKNTSYVGSSPMSRDHLREISNPKIVNKLSPRLTAVKLPIKGAGEYTLVPIIKHSKGYKINTKELTFIFRWPSKDFQIAYLNEINNYCLPDYDVYRWGTGEGGTRGLIFAAEDKIIVWRVGKHINESRLEFLQRDNHDNLFKGNLFGDRGKIEIEFDDNLKSAHQGIVSIYESNGKFRTKLNMTIKRDDGFWE